MHIPLALSNADYGEFSRRVSSATAQAVDEGRVRSKSVSHAVLALVFSLGRPTASAGRTHGKRGPSLAAT